jgi:hypothetical protein
MPGPVVDPRLVAALTAQLEGWRATLGAGATRVGCKLGVGDAERIGDELAIGHLTSATLLAPGAAYTAGVAANIFHRAVAFGPLRPPPLSSGLHGRLLVNGRQAASAPVAGDVAARVAAAARVLAAVGERLQPGDRLITGSVVQIPVRPGDRVTADLGPLGRVGLTITA